MSEMRHNYFDDTIVINNIVSDDSEDIITIYSRNPRKKYADKKNSYKISPNGRIVINNLMGELQEKSLKQGNLRDLLVEELIKIGFERVPTNLTEEELKDIFEYSISKMVRKIGFGKMEPYRVKLTDSGDLEIMLLIYNGNGLSLTLDQFPLKLKDANQKVVFAGLFDFNIEVSSDRIGICCIKINKDVLKEKDMDLTTWSITFEMQ